MRKELWWTPSGGWWSCKLIRPPSSGASNIIIYGFVNQVNEDLKTIKAFFITLDVFVHRLVKIKRFKPTWKYDCLEIKLLKGHTLLH